MGELSQGGGGAHTGVKNAHLSQLQQSLLLNVYLLSRIQMGKSKQKLKHSKPKMK